MTKNKASILAIGFLLILAIIATLIHNSKSPGLLKAGTSSSTVLPPTFKLNTINYADGWGYEIYIDSALFIIQENIPGVSGNQQFISREEALLCGELMIKKLKQKQRPTITKHDLDSLGISY